MIKFILSAHHEIVDREAASSSSPGYYPQCYFAGNDLFPLKLEKLSGTDDKEMHVCQYYR